MSQLSTAFEKHSEGETGKKKKMLIREEFQVSQLSKGSHIRLVENLIIGEGRASEDQHFY